MTSTPLSEPNADRLFTRTEVQRGLPEKRASMLLFLIECEVMLHVTRLKSIVAATGVMPEAGLWGAMTILDEIDAQTASADLSDPIAALKLARQGHGHPTIWEIERYANTWAAGVPETPVLRAATARQMAQKYRFTAAMAPGIRRNLGLDTGPVQTAFEALYGRPLSTLYAPQVTLADRFNELGARVSNILVYVGRTMTGRPT